MSCLIGFLKCTAMNVGRLLHISLQLGQFLRLGIQATEPCPTRTQLYSPFSWALLQARLSRQAGHVQPQVFHTQCWAGSQADHSRQPDHDQPQLYNGVQLCRGLFHINCAIGPRLVHNIMHSTICTTTRTSDPQHSSPL